MLIRDAEVDGARVDVVLADGAISAIGPSGSQRSTGDEAIDAEGGALLPGLHDHHVHLLAMAAAAGSVPVGPPDLHNAIEFAAALRRAASAVEPGAWIRAVGYHESVAGELDRQVLDAIVPGVPLRVQHRSGAMWVLNSAALAVVGAAPEHDGRLVRGDVWLRERVPHHPLDLAALGRRLVSYGLTGVTDLTPTADASEVALLGAAAAAGDLPLAVTITGAATLPPTAAPNLARGPVKVVIGDHSLPSLDDLLGRYKAARSLSRTVAVHCVTREALVLALVAWREVGALPGDRVEHGAVIPPELFEEMAELGLTVVTQPSFVRERGDQYLTDVDVADRPHLWRCRSLVDAGIGVGFGSDAPYGSADPWAMVRSAVERRTAAGRDLGPAEALPSAEALSRLLGDALTPITPRRIAVGMSADLCLLDRPLADQLRDPTSAAVRATLVAGRVVFQRGA